WHSGFICTAKRRGSQATCCSSLQGLTTKATVCSALSDRQMKARMNKRRRLTRNGAVHHKDQKDGVLHKFPRQQGLKPKKGQCNENSTKSYRSFRFHLDGAQFRRFHQHNAGRSQSC